MSASGIARADILDRLSSRGIQLPHLEAALRRGIRCVIVNGLETAPYATARNRLLIETGDEIVDAAADLGAWLEAPAVHLVVNDALGDVIRNLRRRARGRSVVIVAAEDIYPQDHARLLFRLVTGRAPPAGQSPAELGAWIVDVETALRVRRGLCGDRAPAMAVVTVGGDVVQRPGNYWIPAGTSVRAVLDRVGADVPPARLVLGNALVGEQAANAHALIPPGARGLFAWSERAAADQEATGCIRCGSCVDVCPAGIEPITIYNAVECGRPALASRLWPEACMDCGLCDYVCPSYLPLMNGVRAARLTAGHATKDAGHD